MELIYLWVEKYKNIEKQGFNFSPQFECKYENGKLTIIEKKEDEYIKNFFGNNINVTAIVGKNGSGKSSVLKLIRKIIGKEIDDGSFLIFYNKSDNEYNCIYTTDEINANIELKQTKGIDSHIIFPMFDYSLTYDNSMSFKNEQLPVYPKKEKGFLFFHEELVTNQKNILYNYHELKEKGELDKFEDFFQPDSIKILFDLSKLKPNSEEVLEEDSDIKYQELRKKFTENRVIEEALLIIQEIWNLLSDKKRYKEKNEDFEYINALPSLEKELFSLEQKNHNSYADGYSGNNIWVNGQEQKELLFGLNKVELIIEEEENQYCLFTFDINELSKGIIDIILDSFPLRCFEIELLDNEKKLSHLSFGEQQLLFILNQIYSLGAEKDQDLYEKIDIQDLVEQGHDVSNIPQYYKINYIILFDEIDIGFHPEWQKRTIQYIIDFLNSTDDEKYYHLVFTTHSPFLLSDIPKENIVFLNDEPVIKQTFGANIHTLLSDSFFMDKGLMGEFAKNKIKKIVKQLNDHKEEKKFLTEAEQQDIKKIIQAIGEPFLNQKLWNMYQSLFNDTDAEEKRLNEEMARIQKKLESLKK